MNCWICGPQRLVETLCQITGESSGSILRHLEELRSDFGYGELSGYLEAPKSRSAGRITRKTAILPDGIGPLLRPHKRYLERQRQLNPETLVRLWGIQGIGIAPRLQWRLFIPIRVGMETVSWTTRSISDDVDQRYINAKPDEEKIHLREVLYGEELARQAIVICEGPIDAWSIGPGAVATLGVNPSPACVQIMSKFPVRAILFDSDKGARRRADNLCRLLEVFDGDTFNVTLESAKDANAALKSVGGRREIREIRRRFLT